VTTRFILKILISSIFIAASTELARRSTLFGAVLISLPVTSVLAIIWLYRDTGDIAQVQNYSMGIFWAVIPSLILFVSLPLFLKQGIRFEFSLGLSCLATFLSYLLFGFLLSKFGIKI
jgi:hypothetical protein